MPCVIRKIVGDHYENYLELSPDVWRLPDQVETLQTWLRAHRSELDPVSKWVADIGFCMRSDAGGGGPVFTHELMRMCLECNLVVFLSEYPGQA
jgi:hypothetical protein